MADKEYKVDKHIPLPDRTRGVPLDTLEVGDSILFPTEQRNSVQSYASQLKKSTGKLFTVKVEDEANCRVWRTK